MSASAPSAISAQTLEPLRQAFSSAAKITFPSDPDFASQTVSWNLDFTERPLLILWVACTADVVAAIRWLRLHSLPFTVGCGFHSRYSLRNHHVLIHLGGMRRVTVDPTTQLVHLQGGARNADLDAECAKHHLYTTAGTNPDTGCGGLVLGGGIGYLARRLGLAVDNLVEVELVNAEGELVRVNEREHPDLFWACKGAGFNFGVVVSMTLRVHRIGHQLRELTAEDEAISSRYGLPAQEELEHRVLQGFMPYPQAAYPHLMRVLDDRYVQPGVKGQGPMVDRSLFLALVAANGPHGPAAMLGFIYVGDAYEGYRALEQLIEAIGAPLAPPQAIVKPSQPRSLRQITPSLPSTVILTSLTAAALLCSGCDGWVSVTYVELQCSMDPLTPSGFYYERSFIAQTAPPALAEANLQATQRATATPGLEHCVIAMLALGAGGAMTDFLGNGAFSEQQRKGNWFVGAIGNRDPARATRAQLLDWANAARADILPHCSTHYTNSVSGHAGARVIYSGSLGRLREVKQKYDPTNVFCNNQNVVPANMREELSETAQARD